MQYRFAIHFGTLSMFVFMVGPVHNASGQLLISSLYHKKNVDVFSKYILLKKWLYYSEFIVRYFHKRPNQNLKFITISMSDALMYMDTMKMNASYCMSNCYICLLNYICDEKRYILINSLM